MSQHHKTPIDLVSLPCITAADVQQAIDTSYPYPVQGGTVWRTIDDLPDVVDDPRWAFYILGIIDEDGLATGDFYYYNGTSWTLIPLVDGSKIANGTITLNKLSLVGSSPYYIIQVDALGTSLIWTSIINAIQDDTLPPIKLIAPDAISNYILTSFAGVKAFVTYAAFFANVGSNVIPVDALVRAGADTLGFYLRTKLDGTAIEWANVDVANLAAAGYTAGQSIKRNAGNTGWEAFNSTTTPTAYGPVAMPAIAGAVINFAHGLGHPAYSYKVVARCANGATTSGYALNDEVELVAFWAYTADGEIAFPGFCVFSDVTNLSIKIRGTAALGEYIAVPHKTTGLNIVVTPGDWTIAAYILA